LVLPQARWVLETRLRKLAHGAMKLERLPGIAPGPSPWHGDILLLNHSRESERAGTPYCAQARDNKEQTPLGDLLDPNPRFHGGCFGVSGHTSCEAL